MKEAKPLDFERMSDGELEACLLIEEGAIEKCLAQAHNSPEKKLQSH